MIRKKNVKLKPQIVLTKPYKMIDFEEFKTECLLHDYKIADYPNGDKPVALWGILQTQDIVNGELVDITERQVQEKKDELLKDISSKAREFFTSDDCIIEFSINDLKPNKGQNIAKNKNEVEFIYIKASDENLNKLCGYYSIMEGEEKVEWCDEKGTIASLTKEQVKIIVVEIQRQQSNVWGEQWTSYEEQINNCETLEELDKIKIEYHII